MKGMQTIKDLSKNELEAKLVTLRTEQFTLRAKKSTGSLEKPADLGILRKKIARVLTLINSKKVVDTKKIKNSKKEVSKSKEEILGGEKNHG